MNISNKIAVVDIDGTLIRGQSQMYFISFLRDNKLIAFWQYVLIIGWFVLYKANLVKNTSRILGFALSCFKGKSIDVLRSYAKDFVKVVLISKYYKYSKELLNVLKTSGYEVILLSSAVEPIVTAIAKDLGIEEYISTELEVERGVFNGRLKSQQVYAQNKVTFLNKYLLTRGISLESITAIADHTSDKLLLESVGHAIIANPSKGMFIWAKQKNMPVIYLNNNEFVQYLKSYIKSE